MIRLKTFEASTDHCLLILEILVHWSLWPLALNRESESLRALHVLHIADASQIAKSQTVSTVGLPCGCGDFERSTTHVFPLRMPPLLAKRC